MTITKEACIWLALKSRIDTLSTSFPKAWPGIPYDPQGKAYWRVGSASVDPVRVLIDDGKPHIRTGSLVITLVHPFDQVESAAFIQIASTVAAHFADGTTMRYGKACVTVPRYPSVRDGYEDAGWWTVPVVIPWRTFL